MKPFLVSKKHRFCLQDILCEPLPPGAATSVDDATAIGGQFAGTIAVQVREKAFCVHFPL